MNYNRVMLGGNLTREPECRFLTNGKAVCAFGLAVNREWKSESGEKKSEALFCDCTAFGRTAEVIGQHLRKGSPIFVEGRLKLDTWDDKQSGQKRSKLCVVVEAFQFMGAKEQGGEPAPSAPRYVRPEPSNEPDPMEDDSVPF